MPYMMSNARAPDSLKYHLNFEGITQKKSPAVKLTILLLEVASGLEPLCPVLQTGD